MSEANSRVEEEPRYAPRQALLDLPAPLPLPGRIRVALFRGFAFARPRLKLWLRARQEIRCTFCCWPPGPLARRERRAYPLRYVRSEQHSQRACGPQPAGARRRAGICFVAAPRRCPTSPSSRRLASARPALAPKCEFISARALRVNSEPHCGHAENAEKNPLLAGKDFSREIFALFAASR